MTKAVNGKIMLMVYANGNEAFELNLFNEDWAFDQGQEIDAELMFDGTTFPLSGVEVRNANVLTLLGAGEEEGFQQPFEGSSNLVFRMGREQITVDLAGSRAATAALWSCVARWSVPVRSVRTCSTLSSRPLADNHLGSKIGSGRLADRERPPVGVG